jgi:hypothetical protein
MPSTVFSSKTFISGLTNGAVPTKYLPSAHIFDTIKKNNQKEWASKNPALTFPGDPIAFQGSSFDYAICAIDATLALSPEVDNNEEFAEQCFNQIEAARFLSSGLQLLIYSKLEYFIKNMYFYCDLIINGLEKFHCTFPHFANLSRQVEAQVRWKEFKDDFYFFAVGEPMENLPSFRTVNDYRILNNMQRHYTGILSDENYEYNTISMKTTSDLRLRTNHDIPYERLDLENVVYDCNKFSSALYNKLSTILRNREYI